MIDSIFFRYLFCIIVDYGWSNKETVFLGWQILFAMFKFSLFDNNLVPFVLKPLFKIDPAHACYALHRKLTLTNYFNSPNKLKLKIREYFLLFYTLRTIDSFQHHLVHSILVGSTETGLNYFLSLKKILLKKNSKFIWIKQSFSFLLF